MMDKYCRDPVMEWNRDESLIVTLPSLVKSKEEIMGVG